MLIRRRHIGIVAVILLLRTADAYGRFGDATAPRKNALPGPDRVLVLDGKTIHNVGELQMHFINWGEWGSRPGTAEPYSFSPSAQWPAGSGIEYLFSAGLWIGALKNGVPAVSTAAFENEFRPTSDPDDGVFRSFEGAKGGRTYPSPGADDDRDGLVNEDQLDGIDNDGDGAIDEDYAAISTQMLTCRYFDNISVSQRIYPQHNPLNIQVHQESYQWDGERFNDFIGMRFDITNVGDDLLQDVYVGFFVDGDAGQRDRSRYWEDDMVGMRRIPVVCTDLGTVQYDIAYTYDADGDDDTALGYFGIMYLGHPTDGMGLSAPSDVSIVSFAHFSGRQTFELGGDPTNDFERYELMASHTRDDDADTPLDYRMLVAAGPFSLLLPDSTITVQMAFVAGEGLDGIVANAANAQAAYNGAWFDADEDPTTGVEGREFPVVGPTRVKIDSCREFKSRLVMGCDTDRVDALFNKAAQILPGEVVWINNDCAEECIAKSACGYQEEDSLLFRSGVGGREYAAKWVLTTPPPPPFLRADDHARDGVVLYWDNFSEVTPDGKTQQLDFEGYQIWRADNWTRPLGTSSDTGPPGELWSSLFQVDLVNRFGEDTGMDQLRYDPLNHLLTPEQKTDFINYMVDYLVEFDNADPPCPQGVGEEVCDTLKALARHEAGFEGGRQYYRWVDTTVHLGRPYFYSIIAYDANSIQVGNRVEFFEGIAGDPTANFIFVEPKSAAQHPSRYEENEIYVVPNPATNESMAAWALDPNNDDPTGVKVEFRNLPAARGTIRIFTMAGDLVEELPFDANAVGGTVEWDLVSRNGQSITSGVYIYSIEFENNAFDRVIKKFTVIR